MFKIIKIIKINFFFKHPTALQRLPSTVTYLDLPPISPVISATPQGITPSITPHRGGVGALWRRYSGKKRPTADSLITFTVPYL